MRGVDARCVIRDARRGGVYRLMIIDGMAFFLLLNLYYNMGGINRAYTLEIYFRIGNKAREYRRTKMEKRFYILWNKR